CACTTSVDSCLRTVAGGDLNDLLVLVLIPLCGCMIALLYSLLRAKLFSSIGHPVELAAVFAVSGPAGTMFGAREPIEREIGIRPCLPMLTLTEAGAASASWAVVIPLLGARPVRPSILGPRRRRVSEANGIKQVGYFDCAGGGQVVVRGHVA